MIIVAGWLDFADGEATPYLAMRQSAIEATLEEPGCLEYTFTADPVRTGRVHLFERWATQEDLDVHQQLLRSRQSGPPAFTPTARDVTIYEATPLTKFP